MAMFKQMLLCLAAAAILPGKAMAADDWQPRDGGEIAFFPMAYAPFPHVSRARGHRYREEFFPPDPHYSDSTTAFFIPPGYQAGERTDLLFYFHGWGAHVREALDRFDLTGQVARSGKNVILVFPEGPKDAKDSTLGKIEDDGGLGRLAQETLIVLRREGKIPEDSTLGTVVLSGHSGAYRGMAFAAQLGGLEEHIREIYLLDASYALLDKFADWAGRHSENGRLLSIYTDHLREDNEALLAMLKERGLETTVTTHEEATAELLRTSPRVLMHTATLDHNQAVQRLESFLATSPHLQDCPPQTTVPEE